MTSHVSSKYLSGINIGYIAKIENDSNNLTKTAYITPAADFSHLEEVFVITDQVQKTAPGSITANAPKREPPMNPNKVQAGEK